MDFHSKHEQRVYIKRLKNHFSNNQLENLSIDVIKNLEKDTTFIQAQNILLYHSLPDEVNTRPLIDNWFKKKNFFLPKVNGSTLTIHPYISPNSLSKGKFNIMEPNTPPMNNIEDLDLVIVPGMAFDKQGNRLGRGKGFYDHLFADSRFNTIPKFGLAFAFQLLPSIICEEHDIKMNKIITG